MEKEQLGVPAGYKAICRLHKKLSVGSRMKAFTLRDEMLRFKAGAGWVDTFRAFQVEFAKFARLIGGFPDLKLTEPDCCMVVLKNLGIEVKRYILLHAKIDSMVALEEAIKFYNSNLKILQFADGKGKGRERDDHANPLQFPNAKGGGKEKNHKRNPKGGKGGDKGSRDNPKGGKGKKGKGDEKGKKGDKNDPKKGKGKDQANQATAEDKKKGKVCHNCHEE